MPPGRTTNGKKGFHVSPIRLSDDDETVLGRGLIDMIKMAPETARRCEEKREGRGVSPGEAIRRRSLQPFRRRDDVGHLPGYLVAKDLKAERLPAPSLRVSEADGLTPFRPYL